MLDFHKTLNKCILIIAIGAIPVLALGIQSDTFPRDEPKVSNRDASAYQAAKNSIAREINQISKVVLNPSRTYKNAEITKAQQTSILNKSAVIKKNAATIVKLGQNTKNKTAISLGNALLFTTGNLNKQLKINPSSKSVSKEVKTLTQLGKNLGKLNF